MKKLLALTLSLASIGFIAPATEAKAAANSPATVIAAKTIAPAAQYGIRQQRRNNRAARTVTQTRRVRVGRQVYRETYQVRYLPNGRTRTKLISRVRVR